MAPASYCELEVSRMIADLGASEHPLCVLDIWNLSFGNLHDRFDSLLDKLTFDSAHCRVAAQLKAETCVLLLQAYSEHGQVYSQVLDELERLDRVRVLLAERSRLRADSSAAVSAELVKLAAELSFWLPGLNWEQHEGL